METNIFDLKKWEAVPSSPAQDWEVVAFREAELSGECNSKEEKKIEEILNRN